MNPESQLNALLQAKVNHKIVKVKSLSQAAAPFFGSLFMS